MLKAMTSPRFPSCAALAATLAMATCMGCGVDDAVFTGAAATSGSGAAGGGGGAGAADPSSSAGTGGAGAGGAASSSGDATSSSAASSSSASSGTGGSGGAVPSGCVTDVTAGHHVFPCMGGINYDVEIPAACAGGGCGLVVDMHGFTMSAASEDKGTAMRALGQQHGYVIVQPTAPGLPSSWDQNTHAPLVAAFVGDAMTALSIDPKRVHAMGFSQGGGMTWRLVCGYANLFASASPIGGLAGCEFSGGNAPSKEIPLLVVHGRKDSVVNFNSTAIPQRDAALAFWSYGPGVVLEDDGVHKATRYTSPAGTILEFWEHDYQAGSIILGGHCFPGGTDVGLSPFQFGCSAAGTFVYGELAMQFFIAHPAP